MKKTTAKKSTSKEIEFLTSVARTIGSTLGTVAAKAGVVTADPPRARQRTKARTAGSKLRKARTASKA